MRNRDSKNSGTGTDARRATSNVDLRAHIAAEAARIISESGIRDFSLAKRKAAARLGARDEASVPGNDEIEEALRIHQRLFQTDEQPQQLTRLRKVALEAMNFLAEFKPHLVGAVLNGSADRHSSVCLHLFSDDPDAPARFLAERSIRYRAKARRMRTSQTHQVEFPVLLLDADGTTIDLTIFAIDDARLAPIDTATGKAMRRVGTKGLSNLLGAD